MDLFRLFARDFSSWLMDCLDCLLLFSTLNHRSSLSQLATFSRLSVFRFTKKKTTHAKACASFVQVCFHADGQKVAGFSENILSALATGFSLGKFLPVQRLILDSGPVDFLCLFSKEFWMINPFTVGYSRLKRFVYMRIKSITPVFSIFTYCFVSNDTVILNCSYVKRPSYLC